MTLSNLINYKNELEKLSTLSAQSFVNAELEKFLHLTKNQTLYNNLDSLNQAFNQFNSTVDNINQELKSAIEEAERPWFQESYRLHEEEIWRHPADHIFNKCMPTLSPEFTKIIQTRLNSHASWRYAGMLIRPGNGNFINNMVSFDPLYIVDSRYDLLEPSISQYSSLYQSRLRKYTINDLSNEEIFNKFPNEQFGLCVAYMYFNYKPLESIKQYLTELYQKLKAGGTLAFTFNDCDRLAAVKLVERHFCCYTPGYLVRELANSIGFEILYSWHDEGPITWIELRKPGELTSLKGGQTLAKILPK